jgi:hypothetical protein
LGFSWVHQIQPQYGLTGEDTMKLTSFRTGAASAAVLTVLIMGTAIAHADPPPMPAPPPPPVPVLGDEAQNYRYMYALDKEGIALADGNVAYAWGTGVCNALASGRTPDQVAQDWPGVNGAAIVALAQQIYCPAP